MPLFQAPDIDAPVLSQFSLKNKIAIVTGGSRGIGLEIVRGLAEAGADVAFIYKTSQDTAKTAAKTSKQTGVRVQAYKSDVADRNAIMTTIDKIVNEFGKGRLDVMVANAEVCANVDSLEYDEGLWKHMNTVNYDGVMWTAQAAGKVFKKQGRGSLVIKASLSAHLVNVPQTQAAYNASKAAALQLAKSLAVEWADFARVNCVSPGYVPY
jgi:sorbose reductase